MDETPDSSKVAVISRWPTIIARDVLDGHGAHDGTLAAMADAPPDGDLFAADAPAVRWLKRKINATVGDYFEHCTDVGACAWRLSGRLVVRRFNEFQALANAPGRYLTGVYFVAVPKAKRALRLRKDVVSNGVTLLDPRHGMNMNAINGDPYVGQLKEMFGEPGTLMMWPAFVSHWTTPNHSDDPLIVVRFDVAIDDDSDGGDDDGRDGGDRAFAWQRLAVKAPGTDADAGRAAERFEKMWPTHILERRLEDAAEWNDKLVALVSAMEAEHDDLTTEYQGVDLFNRDDPAIAWPGERIQETVNRYLASFVTGFKVRWQLQGWPNINRVGDYHAPHNHCWCYLSGTYYVRLPAADAGDDDGRVPSGAINFADPRQGANLIAVPGDAYAEPNVTLTPEPGTFLMWPASLIHTAYPNRSEEQRITISFNVVLEWDNRYLE